MIALCPPYYPPIHNDDFQSLPASVQDLTDHLIRFADDQWREVYHRANYIMGLTDLSYAALQNGENVIPYLGPNMPLWQKTYDIPFAEMQELSLPVINIGQQQFLLDKEAAHPEHTFATLPRFHPVVLFP